MEPSKAVRQMIDGWNVRQINYKCEYSEQGLYRYYSPPASQTLAQIRQEQPKEYQLEEFVLLVESQNAFK